MNSKALLMGASGKQHLSFLDIAAPVAMEYASKHNYDFCSIRGKAFDDFARTRPPAWAKVPILLAALHTYDIVCWLDCDTIIVDDTLDISDTLTLESPIGIVNQPLSIETFFTVPIERLKTVKLQVSCPNTGVMVLKKTVTTMNLLREIWDGEDGPLWEQSSFLSIMGYEGEWPYLPPKEPSLYADAIQWLDRKWNVHKRHNREEQGYIHHWSHLPYEERVLGLLSDSQNKKHDTTSDYISR